MIHARSVVYLSSYMFLRRKGYFRIERISKIVVVRKHGVLIRWDDILLVRIHHNTISVVPPISRNFPLHPTREKNLEWSTVVVKCVVA